MVIVPILRIIVQKVLLNGSPLPLAAGGEYPVLALALARGERPEPRVGVFREGVLMTRFFWQVCVGVDGESEAAPRAGALSELGTVGRP